MKKIVFITLLSLYIILNASIAKNKFIGILLYFMKIFVITSQKKIKTIINENRFSRELKKKKMKKKKKKKKKKKREKKSLF